MPEPDERGIGRIRLLMNDTRDQKISLQHIIDHCIEMSHSAAKLEVHNNKTALAEQKRMARKGRDMFIEYYNRLVDEVSPEVAEYWQEQPKAKPRGRNIQDNLADSDGDV